MPASTNPPFAVPQPIGTEVNGDPVDWIPNPPPAAPPTSLPSVNGAPVTWTVPSATAGVIINPGLVETDPSPTLNTSVNGAPVDWTPPEAVPGGPTV